MSWTILSRLGRRYYVCHQLSNFLQDRSAANLSLHYPQQRHRSLYAHSLRGKSRYADGFLCPDRPRLDVTLHNPYVVAVRLAQDAYDNTYFHTQQSVDRPRRRTTAFSTLPQTHHIVHIYTRRPERRRAKTRVKHLFRLYYIKQFPDWEQCPEALQSSV